MLFGMGAPQLGWCWGLLAWLGLLVAANTVLRVAWGLIRGLRAFFWSRLWTPDYRAIYGGDWAVVTGGTDGIGKEYARQLAAAGLNVLIIARNTDKLSNVAQQIRQESGRQVETAQVDFSQGRPVYAHLAPQLHHKRVAILVNNVGVGLGGPTYFGDVSEDTVWSLINVNVGAVVAVTRLLLPQMVARGKGAIINISSLTSSFPVPFITLYSASKVFVDYFCESLAWEYRPLGVTVQTVRPGPTVTNMTRLYTEDLKCLKQGVMMPSADNFVRSALASLGYTTNTAGYWSHALQGIVLAELPRWLMVWVSSSRYLQLIQSLRAREKRDS